MQYWNLIAAGANKRCSSDRQKATDVQQKYNEVVTESKYCLIVQVLFLRRGVLSMIKLWIKNMGKKYTHWWPDGLITERIL